VKSKVTCFAPTRRVTVRITVAVRTTTSGGGTDVVRTLALGWTVIIPALFATFWDAGVVVTVGAFSTVTIVSIGTPITTVSTTSTFIIAAKVTRSITIAVILTCISPKSCILTNRPSTNQASASL